MDRIYSEIFAELDRAIDKFPTWPSDPLHAIAVLGEEYGELVKGVLQLVYEPHKTNLEAVRQEAVQTAAMAIRFMVSFDVYNYQKSQQHGQQLNLFTQRTAR